MCQSDRTWVPSQEYRDVSCAVPVLQNGYYMLDNSQVAAGSVLALPSVLTPLCSVGYTPVLPKTRTCQIKDQWTGQPPSCSALTCGNLLQGIVNGYYDVEGHSSPYEYNGAIMQRWVLSPARREKAMHWNKLMEVEMTLCVFRLRVHPQKHLDMEHII